MIPDTDYAEILLKEAMEATGKPEGQVRAVCSALQGPALTDRGLQWKICNDYGWLWEHLQVVLSLGANNIAAIGRGIATVGVAITSATQNLLVQELAKGEMLDLDRAKAFSAISKQQNDLARSWLADPAPQQHVHFHGSAEGIEALRMLRDQRANQKPAVERLRDKGVEV